MKKQAPKRTTMQLLEEDRAAVRRILNRHPVIRTNTDAVRHAIHFTDSVESAAEQAS